MTSLHAACVLPLLLAGSQAAARMAPAPSQDAPFIRWAIGTADPWVHADGTRLLTGTGRCCYLWDVHSGELLAIFGRGDRRATFARYLPDGRRILTGHLGSAISIWDGETARFERQYWAPTFNGSDLWFSDDGSRFLTTKRREATLWNPFTDEILRRFEMRAGECAALSPDGTRVLTFAQRGTGALWDVEIEAPLIELQVPGTNRLQCGFGPRSRIAYVITPDQGLSHLLDARSGRRLPRLSWQVEELSAVAITPDSETLIAGDREGRLHWFETDTGRHLRRIPAHDRKVESLELSRDGELLLSRGRRPALRVAGADDGRLLWEIGVRDGSPLSVGGVFSPDGRWVICRERWDGAAQVRDARSGEILAVLGSALGDVSTPAAHPDGTRMAIPCGDGSIRIVELATGTQLACIDAHSDRVDLVAWDPTGERLSSCGRDGRLKVWDASSGRLLSAVRAFEIEGWQEPRAHFSPDGERILCWDSHGESFAIWQADEGRLLTRIDLVSWSINAAAWSPDDECVAIGGSGVHLFDGRSGEATGVHLEHEETVADLSFDPDGDHLVTSDIEGRAYIWSLSSGKRLYALPHPEAIFGPEHVEVVVVSPDGSLVATGAGSDCRVLCWEMESGRLRWNVPAGWSSDACEGELKLRFNPDGTRLYVSESWGGAVRILDVQSGEPIGDPHTFSGVADLGSTADDRLLLELLGSSVRIRDGRTLRRLYTFVPCEDGAHLTIAPSMHYEGDPSAARRAHMVMGESSLPLDSYASLLCDPEAVIASIAGEELERPHLPPPPLLELIAPPGRIQEIAGATWSIEAVGTGPGGMLGFEIEQDGHLLPAGLVRSAVSLTDDGLRARLGLAIPEERRRAGTTFRICAVSSAGILSRPALVTFR